MPIFERFVGVLNRQIIFTRSIGFACDDSEQNLIVASHSINRCAWFVCTYLKTRIMNTNRWKNGYPFNYVFENGIGG